LAKIKLDNAPDDCGVNGENLFLINKNEKYYTISMYNHKFEMVQKFGQENSLLPFFFSPKTGPFLVSNQYFIFIETSYDEDDKYHNRLTIINRSNGLVESSFKIYEGFHRMQLYLDKFLITFNDETRSLKCFNLKGDLLGKITLEKKFEGSLFNVINKGLCFFLKSNNICIF
jgi:hypothetical protein